LSFEGSQVELSNPQGETSNLSLKPRMYQEIYFITQKKRKKKKHVLLWEVSEKGYPVRY
jgi:hypothetical protein